MGWLVDDGKKGVMKEKERDICRKTRGSPLEGVTSFDFSDSSFPCGKPNGLLSVQIYFTGERPAVRHDISIV